jgi:DNA invertase Pin-like site-specific DNA recombinase
MKVGYIRVSTKDQNTCRQEELMKELGVDKFFIEKISGKDRNRPQLRDMLDFVRESDVVIVESYSRLSRSSADLLNIINELNNKKVGFISQKENFDTSTPQGKFMLTVFAGLYELDRESILQRQKEGIDIAKRKGAFKGRKPLKVDDKQFQKIYNNWKDGKITAVRAMQLLNLKKTSFYQKVKDFEKGNLNKKSKSYEEKQKKYKEERDNVIC